jgi:hypothetical protein
MIISFSLTLLGIQRDPGRAVAAQLILILNVTQEVADRALTPSDVNCDYYTRNSLIGGVRAERSSTEIEPGMGAGFQWPRGALAPGTG